MGHPEFLLFLFTCFVGVSVFFRSVPGRAIVHWVRWPDQLGLWDAHKQPVWCYSVVPDIVCELHSCSNSPVKSGRRFSWHGASAENVSEFFSTRLLLFHRYPDGQPDASSKKFSQLRSDMGGLQLALHCTSWSTWMGVQVLRIVSQPCWNYHSQTVTTARPWSQSKAPDRDFSAQLTWQQIWSGWNATSWLA